jgi:hypothetical protein
MKYGWTVLVAAVSLPLGLLACGDDPAPLGPDEGNASLTGAVAFVKTGQGVQGLVVALLRGGEVVRTTHTDVNGAFAFEGVAEGSYAARLTGFDLTGLNLRATAFDPIQQGVTLGSDPVDLAFAAVGLVPPRVAGDVTCGGVAVEGARLRVVGGEDADVEVVTDVRGRYAATGLSEGAFAVIPLTSPCVLSPAFGTVKVGKGQAGEVDFAG